MRSPSLFFLLAAMLPAYIAAEPLHHSAICITYADKNKVYQKEATEKACLAYRNQEEPKCDDCGMMTIKNMYLCHSGRYLIGGKEMTQHCKNAGAHDSVRNSY